MHAVPRELVELGQDVVAKVAHGLATGAGAVHLQLLASEFYETLRAELARTPREHAAKVGVLAAVADQCRRSATAGLDPTLMVVELRAAVAMLSSPGAGNAPLRFRPQLRVIQGGLV